MAWYGEIADSALHGAVLHADETGHRINGHTHWLWCFTNGNLTYYQIDRSRGHEALQRFFHETFQGTLITDFWAGTGRTDRIWPKDMDVSSLADTDWSIADSAAGVVITVAGHGTLTLAGVHVNQLSADDFIFG